jgi:C-terminal processing protease CtpA/Prc
MPNTTEHLRVLSSRDRERILSAIRKRVFKSFINIAKVNLATWVAELERRKPDLLTVELPAFEDGVRDFLKELKSSHTAFYHGQQNRFLSQHTIGATLKAVEHRGSGRWMFLDIFPEGVAELANIKSGELLCELNGVPVSPPEVPSFETGRGHKLHIAASDGSAVRDIAVVVPFRKGTKSRPPIVEPRAVTSEFIAPDIGILRIPYFSGALGLKFGQDLGKAIDELKAFGTERLVVDLRGNIGGSLGFATLASYLCPDQRPIGYSITPTTLRDGFDKSELQRIPMPRGRASLALTLGRFLFRDKSIVLLTQGLGPQPFHGKIVVLVNEWTNSAGEMVAAFAAENALATVVGTKTAGNVLGAANFEVGSGYWVRLPVIGWFTWSGVCLEGSGVTPDSLIENAPFGIGDRLSEHPEEAFGTLLTHSAGVHRS